MCTGNCANDGGDFLSKFKGYSPATECETCSEPKTVVEPVSSQSAGHSTQLRRERDEAGLCPDCGGKRTDEYKRCSACRSKNRKRYYKKAANNGVDPYASRLGTLTEEELLELRREDDLRAKKANYNKCKDAGVCPRCEKFTPFGFVLCRECNDKEKRAYSESSIFGMCPSCGELHDAPTNKCPECAARDNENARLRNQRLKDEVYSAYGGYVCEGCGETNPACLQVDHVNDDGYAHRKQVGTGTALYQWLKVNGFPDNFQILCANCNWIKRATGETPSRHDSQTDGE